MEKELSYYMNLPYTRELIPEPEGGWFIRIKELPGFMSQGRSPEEAEQMIEDAMRGWLVADLKQGTIMVQDFTFPDLVQMFGDLIVLPEV